MFLTVDGKKLHSNVVKNSQDKFKTIVFDNS